MPRIALFLGLTLLLSGCSSDGSADASGTGGGAGTAGSSAAGASGGGGAGGTAGAAAAGAGGLSFTCPGGTVAPGVNQLTVAGKARSFIADFPSDTSQPMGVLFSWHGYMQKMDLFRADAKLDPDADPSLLVIVITPEDTAMLPPAGLGWDIAKGKPEDANVDLPFFEAMLGCLDEQYDIDPARIYSFGFSAGSVFTALLHSRYPGLLSAVVCESGAWFNDPAEAALVKLFTLAWNWPVLDAADGGAVLLTHGGPTDVTVLNIISLEDASQAALPFLAANQRVVVDCAHTLAHVLHPDVTASVVSQFISAHRGGQPSPYLQAPAPSFPASCTLRLP